MLSGLSWLINESHADDRANSCTLCILNLTVYAGDSRPTPVPIHVDSHFQEQLLDVRSWADFVIQFVKLVERK